MLRYLPRDTISSGWFEFILSEAEGSDERQICPQRLKKISASNPSYKNHELQRVHKYIRIYLYSIIAIVNLIFAF